MRRIAFVITIIGLAILTTQLYAEGTPIENKNDLETLLPETIIQIQGTVQKDTQQGFTLDNNLTVQCEECPPLTGTTISVRGAIKEYRGTKRILALKIQQHYPK